MPFNQFITLYFYNIGIKLHSLSLSFFSLFCEVTEMLLWIFIFCYWGKWKSKYYICCSFCSPSYPTLTLWTQEMWKWSIFAVFNHLRIWTKISLKSFTSDFPDLCHERQQTGENLSSFNFFSPYRNAFCQNTRLLLNVCQRRN